MPHTVALSGWPFYFLNLSTIKKVKKSVGSKIEKEKKEETDGSKSKNEFFREIDTKFNQQDNSTKPPCLCCLGVPNMEAGLPSINKLLMSVIGQPRGNLLTSQTPITNEFKISDTVLGLGINGKVSINITHLLCTAFSYESVFLSFSVITVWLYNFLAKEYRRKSCS